jgi:hypothetical protein
MTYFSVEKVLPHSSRGNAGQKHISEPLCPGGGAIHRHRENRSLCPALPRAGQIAPGQCGVLVFDKTPTPRLEGNGERYE